ncbi:MAG: Os1348 family NHLP clan protein [Ktedonobacteraceae bacterium]
MSWKTINRIIGLASINLPFQQQLQENPLNALEVQGFELTPEELEVFRALALLPFPQFCQRLQEKLAPEDRGGGCE